MKPRSFLVALLLVIGLLTSITPSATSAEPAQFCATAHPEDVLQCLSQAYALRDTLQYARLLADDYAAYYENNPTPMSTREIELKAVRGMFNTDSLKSFSLTFGKDFTISAGEAPDTWIISNASEVMTLGVMHRGQLRHQDVTNSRIEVRIRRVQEPVPHFQIYRWWVKPEE
jgi:hypothetical protein